MPGPFDSFAKLCRIRWRRRGDRVWPSRARATAGAAVTGTAGSSNGYFGQQGGQGYTQLRGDPREHVSGRDLRSGLDHVQITRGDAAQPGDRGDRAVAVFLPVALDLPPTARFGGADVIVVAPFRRRARTVSVELGPGTHLRSGAVSSDTSRPSDGWVVGGPCMARLVLWDIDHTLIDTRGVGRELSAAAFFRATGQTMREQATHRRHHRAGDLP